jgi:hypothetical protein
MFQYAIEEAMVGIAQLLEKTVECLMKPPDGSCCFRDGVRTITFLIQRHLHRKEVMDQRWNNCSGQQV